MKKLLSLGLVLSAVALTGCSQSAPTLEEVESVIDRIDEYENVVITITEFEQSVVQITKDMKKAYTEEETITTYEFSDGKLKHTVENIINEKLGSNYIKEYEKTEYIYDFDNGFVYEVIGDIGIYEKSSISSYYTTFTYKYDYAANLSFLSYFMDDDFTTSYENDRTYYIENYNIYNGGGFDLSYVVESVYKEDLASQMGYHLFSSSEMKTYTIEFKDSNIKVPSDSQIFNF